MLNGADITNVPTDFSKYPNGDLEVVFTPLPEMLAGRVTDPEGRLIPGAWVVICTVDPNPPQVWATTSQAMQANEKGLFWVTSLPGRYVVRAFAPSAFSSRTDALDQLRQLGPGGFVVELGERERKTLALIVDEP